MERRLSRTLTFFTLIILALIGTLTLRHAFSPAAPTHPGNRRATIGQFSVHRGSILARDGSVLASSDLVDGQYIRDYALGKSFAPVTGYFDPIQGQAGLEARWGPWLSGKDHFRSPQDWLISLTNQNRSGFDLTLAVETDLQSLSYELLAGKRGAIVALDPRSGAVRAMASRPSYDPNLIKNGWDALDTTDGVLLNKAAVSLYPPGSTFKIITAAAALEHKTADPSTKYDAPAVLPVFGSSVTNFDERDAGRLRLDTAFTKSVNTVFAQVGLELGAGRLISTSRDFGLGSDIPFDAPAEASRVPAPNTMDQVMTAWTSVGQGETLVTPLQMSLVAAAVANDGIIYEPYLVSTARDFQGLEIFRRDRRQWRRPFSRTTARALKKMMVSAVNDGTGRAADLPGIEVAGKTGTAEIGGGREPHAWFVGFAPAEEPVIAVAVIVENGGLGGAVAAPLASQIIEKAIGNSK